MSWWTSTALGTPLWWRACWLFRALSSYSVRAPLVGLRGGRAEAEKLWPFTVTDETGPKILLHLTAHALTAGALFVLMVLAVLTGFVEL